MDARPGRGLLERALCASARRATRAAVHEPCPNLRFGLSWQVVPAMFWQLVEDPARSGRDMRALMQMVKPDIAALQAAADGR